MDKVNGQTLEYAEMLERLKRMNHVAYRYFIGLLKAFLGDS